MGYVNRSRSDLINLDGMDSGTEYGTYIRVVQTSVNQGFDGRGALVQFTSPTDINTTGAFPGELRSRRMKSPPFMPRYHHNPSGGIGCSQYSVVSVHVATP